MKQARSAIVVSLLAALAIPAQMIGQEQLTGQQQKQHTHYRLIDLGTFGGPASYLQNGFDGLLNNRGIAAGWADTSTPDPNPSFCFNPDCFVSHAFQSQNGALTDLGTLPGGASSQTTWITANGLISGNSQNGQIDPLFSGFPENRAVLWNNGEITDLGTLPEGGYESFASTVNSRGQAVGFALNTIPDPFSLAGPGFFPTQTRAFLWQNGAMQDLGTLGGSGAFAILVNERGQIAGESYTDSTPNSSTGLPTVHSFLWENGTMRDLGSLGGTLGNPTGFNNRGQVIGVSNLAGDLTSHPFLWTKNHGMQDLGTLGGDNGFANWINDDGVIAGKADLPGPLPQNHDAVLWRHGAMIDLGTVPGDSCANAYYVNASGQVVGTSEDQELCLIPTGQHAFLWESGGPMVDLNSLIPTGSSLQLTFAVAINDRGEIAGFGVPAGCAPQDVDLCGHAYVLIPCNENSMSDCQETIAGETAAAPASAEHLARQTPLANPRNSIVSMLPRRLGPLSGVHRPAAFPNGFDLTASPGATLSETSLMFPGQNVGTTSRAMTVTLTNSGGATLNVTDIDTTAHFAERDNCVGSLAPATSCEINITFTPSTTGSLTGMLLVTDNASGSPQAVKLSGAGIISHNKLTGACLLLRPTPNLWRCYLTGVQDLKQCPAGQTANEPVREEGCLFLPSDPSPLEDLSRSCSRSGSGVGGVCEAK